MRRLVLHVDRLVLRGFPAGDREALAEGLRAELARLLAEPGAGPRLASRAGAARIAAGEVRLEASAGPERVGTEAARRIARRLGS